MKRAKRSSLRRSAVFSAAAAATLASARCWADRIDSLKSANAKPTKRKTHKADQPATGAGTTTPCGGKKKNVAERAPRTAATKDRKSTRLNSSHMSISYAVFCLKKQEK